MKIILASGSPRRKQILSDAGINFEVKVSSFDENLESLEFNREKIEHIAYKKALEVAKEFPQQVVIGADTVVVLDNQIFTKPKTREEAFSMLRRLSANTHFVQTSVCMLFKTKKMITSTKTYVTFKKLSDELIKEYIDKYNPLDKAGSYGIQELSQDFVERINGDIENVIGISSTVVKDMLRKINKQ